MGIEPTADAADALATRSASSRTPATSGVVGFSVAEETNDHPLICLQILSK